MEPPPIPPVILDKLYFNEHKSAPQRSMDDSIEISLLITIFNDLPKNMNKDSIAQRYSQIDKRRGERDTHKKRSFRIKLDPLLVELSMAKNLAYAKVSQWAEDADTDGVRKAFDKAPNSNFEAAKHPAVSLFPTIKYSEIVSRVGGHFFATASCQGNENTMQDYASIPKEVLNLQFTSTSKPQNAVLFGLFDGHNGEDCAKYYASNLKAEFIDEFFHSTLLSQDPNTIICNALNKTLVKMDQNFSSGTTALIALLVNRTVYIANVGDSKAIILTKTDAIALNDAASHKKKRFRKKVEARGGIVNAATGFVQETLEATCSSTSCLGSNNISDVNGNKVVPNRPQVTKMSLEDNILILATRGIWQVANPKQIHTTWNALNTSGSLSLGSRDLIKKALLANSPSNITVIAIN